MAKKNVVYFDRYYYDFLVDFHRYRISLPSWVARRFLLMVPKPDVVIILQCDALIIQKRKNELSFDEIVRQNCAYASLNTILNGCSIVDSGMSLDEVCRQVASIILQERSRKTLAAMRTNEVGVLES